MEIVNNYPIKKTLLDTCKIFNKEFTTKEEAIEWAKNQPEPEFILPVTNRELKEKFEEQGFKESDNLEINQWRKEYNSITPVSPKIVEAEKLTPNTIVPGFPEDPLEVQFLSTAKYKIIHKSKVIQYMNAEIEAKNIVYRNIPFAEGIAMVKLPWNEIDVPITTMSLNEIPNEYIIEKRILFSKEIARQINRIFVDGWNESTYWVAELPKGTALIILSGDEYWYFGYYENTEKLADYFLVEAIDQWFNLKKVQEIDSEILREADSIEEILEFLSF